MTVRWRDSAGCRMAREDGIRSRRRLAELESRRRPVGQRIAQEIEPLPAAIGVTPALDTLTFDVGAEVQVPPPHFIVGFQRRPHQRGGAAIHELDLIAFAAPGTGKPHHQCAIPEAAASSTSFPVMKRFNWNGSASS